LKANTQVAAITSSKITKDQNSKVLDAFVKDKPSASVSLIKENTRERDITPQNSRNKKQMAEIVRPSGIIGDGMAKVSSSNTHMVDSGSSTVF
jgi:hypothetical protein